MALSTLGLRHLALYVRNLEACTEFYTQILGMKIDWQPDADNIYLSTGHDNLALHRADPHFAPNQWQHLDHFGFMIPSKAEVSEWYDYMKTAGVSMKSEVKSHRDGATSFYCSDPEGNIIQMIHCPNIG